MRIQHLNLCLLSVSPSVRIYGTVANLTSGTILLSKYISRCDSVYNDTELIIVTWHNWYFSGGDDLPMFKSWIPTKSKTHSSLMYQFAVCLSEKYSTVCSLSVL